MEDMYIIEYWIGNARKLYTTADTQGAYKFYSEQSKARLLQVKYDETIETAIKAHKGIEDVCTTRIYGFMAKVVGYAEGGEKYVYTIINFYPEKWQQNEDYIKYKNKKHAKYEILLHNRGGECFFIKSN